MVEAFFVDHNLTAITFRKTTCTMAVLKSSVLSADSNIPYFYKGCCDCMDPSIADTRINIDINIKTRLLWALPGSLVSV
jgi:hypothetical protein